MNILKDSINQNCQYSLWYPNYTEKTSKQHRLTGWGLFSFGQHNNINFLKNLDNKIKKKI